VRKDDYLDFFLSFFLFMLILPTPYDIDSRYTIRRIQPQIVYVRTQNNNQYQCSPFASICPAAISTNISLSKGNELKAGEIKRTIL
jgi:hypothetical protein